ncbi:Mu transposase C-terminal domain-containing protein [Ralstonia sp. 22086]|uniref:Mu transposase C-terminal domain-containing protein n=1 Tax=unclassified Ralstonia TaxID=209769 RepID=UPI0011BD736E|nr:MULTISPECIES: Mu transposase C-terminal domain-containing protein [unclassified Ralstonia]TXD58303.1 DDE-type integrase/transposase/recombinase [Ralstonia sp. TCR112]HWV04077.1 Mu transposase C-terminal domain-containing protein [Ralstonia sp.]
MASKPLAKTPTVLHIRKGSSVSHDGRTYTILRYADLDKVLAREVASGETVILNVGSLKTPFKGSDNSPEPRDQVDLEDVSNDAWEIAQSRLDTISPLLDRRRNRTKADYVAVAANAGVSVPTLYNWLSAYSDSELLSSLIPTPKDGGRGRSRLAPEVKLILDDYVQEQYLTQQRPSVAKAAREIRRRCHVAELDPLPAVSTIYRHLGWLDERESLKRREGRRAAEQRFRVNIGSIPDAEYPLAIVQVDHTLLPVIIVDDKHRKPIGRAWITLAIDVFSRVCLGMYLSLDPPSAMSAGMCISHAILPKSDWMARQGCGDIEWPFHGPMDVLHMDNAKEFRGKMLAVATREYHIDIHLRPVKQPRYGAHIERLMGTVSEELKGLKGATFANPQQKGEYDAEGNACMTFDELEKWLVLMFARYHRDVHSGIGTTPMTKWREGILGTRGKMGRGIPPILTDAEKVRIDFMPYTERTIQGDGVRENGIHYFHDVLRPWVGERDPDNPKRGKQFRFRYDPRDMSVLYFFDTDLKRYQSIPYRDSSLPPASIWEIRAAKSAAKAAGMKDYSERDLFALIARQRELEEAAAAKTKAARRAEQQRKQQDKARARKSQDLPRASKVEPSRSAPAIRGYDPDDIQPLSDDE